MDKVLVIGGPTAVGKTQLSIELAQKFDGEIISGDSMQVYRKLDIGTAKVTPEEMQNIPHHLIDIKDIHDEYSTHEFQQKGRQLITEITNRGKLPIVAGGTGLYIQSLLYDFHLGNVPNDRAKKQFYEDYLAKYGSEKLWQLLAEKDAQTAAKIHPHNPRRIVRALEVIDNGGYIEQDTKPELLYDAKIIALNTDRQLLYERINLRVDKMLEQGLLDEAKYVYEAGDVQGAKAIGYKEFFAYFRGEQKLDEAVELLKQQSRRYAKRQITWFKNRLNADWYDLLLDEQAKENLIADVERWLKNE